MLIGSCIITIGVLLMIHAWQKYYGIVKGPHHEETWLNVGKGAFSLILLGILFLIF